MGRLFISSILSAFQILAYFQKYSSQSNFELDNSIFLVIFLTSYVCFLTGQARSPRRAMIIGIGIDIVDLGRFKKRLTPELIEELFLPDEIAYCRTQRRNEENYAARFGAKEAVFKALGAGLEQGLRWHDVEVVKKESGAVRIQMSGRAAELANQKSVTQSFLSLSHSRDNAIAMVVLENCTPIPEEEP